jgi:hypothetical protein
MKQYACRTLKNEEVLTYKINLCLQWLTNHSLATHQISKLGLQVAKYKTASFGNAPILGRYYVILSSIQTWHNARKRRWLIWMNSYVSTSLRIAGPWVGARLYAVFLRHIFCLVLRCNSHNHQHELVLYSSPSREHGSSWIIGESCSIMEWKFRRWEDMTARGTCSTFRNTSCYEQDCII